jgi:hypothetical protein
MTTYVLARRFSSDVRFREWATLAWYVTFISFHKLVVINTARFGKVHAAYDNCTDSKCVMVRRFGTDFQADAAAL